MPCPLTGEPWVGQVRFIILSPGTPACVCVCVWGGGGACESGIIVTKFFLVCVCVCVWVRMCARTRVRVCERQK